MHVEGGLLRISTGGSPSIKRETRICIEHLDYIHQFLRCEARGHEESDLGAGMRLEEVDHFM